MLVHIAGYRVAVLTGLSLALALIPQSSPAEEQWTELLPANAAISEHWQTTGNWKKNDDGSVTLTPRPGESGWTRYDAYLWAEGTYDDFQIQFDYKVEPKGNSGFYFNVGDKANPVSSGIEVQIFDEHKGAKLTDHDSGGVIKGIPPTVAAAKPAGEWNQFDITVRGEKLTVKLNGQTVNEVDISQHPQLGGRPSKGAIGFQDHGLPLSLRNIRVRRL